MDFKELCPGVPQNSVWDIKYCRFFPSNESTGISNNTHKPFEFPPMRKTSIGEEQISGIGGEEGVQINHYRIWADTTKNNVWTCQENSVSDLIF